MGDATDQYRQLRDRADGRGGRLVVLHEVHIACRPGCHDCCTDLSVSAVDADREGNFLVAVEYVADDQPVILGHPGKV